MRFYAVLVAGLCAVPATTGALAADFCHHLEMPAPDNASGSIIFESFTVLAGAVATCPAALPIMVPAGTFGVYKVDSRAFNKLATGDAAEYRVLVNGDSQKSLFEGEPSENATITQYFGGTGGTSFSGIFTYDLTKAKMDSESTLDSVDVLLAGTTTLASQQASLEQLSDARTSMLILLNATGGLLTSDLQQLEIPDNFVLLGALGSATFGVTGHYNLDGGLSLDGGVAYSDEDVNGTGVSGAIFAGALRYLQPGSNALRPFGKLAVSVAPGLDMEFSRHYEDGSDSGVIVGSASSSAFFGGALEGGFLYAPNDMNKIAFSGTYARNWLGVDAHDERFSDSNFFAASMNDSSGSFDIVKAALAWTSQISPQLDVTVSASLGEVFSHGGVAADIAFVGLVAGAAQNQFFAEYGARAGWQLSPAAGVNLFLLGTTGEHLGSHVQIGSSLHLQF